MVTYDASAEFCRRLMLHIYYRPRVCGFVLNSEILFFFPEHLRRRDIYFVLKACLYADGGDLIKYAYFSQRFKKCSYVGAKDFYFYNF